MKLPVMQFSSRNHILIHEPTCIAVQLHSCIYTSLHTYIHTYIHGVGIAMGYGMDCPGSITDKARFFSSAQRPDRLWGSPSLLSSGYRWQSSWGMKLTTHLHLMPRSRLAELYLHSPLCLHGIMLN
jgi:hypothetical protein